MKTEAEITIEAAPVKKLTLARSTERTFAMKSKVRTGAYGGDDTGGRGKASDVYG